MKAIFGKWSDEARMMIFMCGIFITSMCIAAIKDPRCTEYRPFFIALLIDSVWYTSLCVYYEMTEEKPSGNFRA